MNGCKIMKVFMCNSFKVDPFTFDKTEGVPQRCQLVIWMMAALYLGI